jgi:hydrogenase maturation protein HypF
MVNDRQRTIHQTRAMPATRWRVMVSGIVQGVGFRPFIYHLAGQLGLSGWVRNTASGVEIELQGSEPQLAQFLARLQTDGPPLAHIVSIDTSPVPALPNQRDGLLIRTSPSRHASDLPAARTLVSPDAATCDQCLREINDSADRRYHYAFTNCTHCGPRFTIMKGLPYDRPFTTMAGFPLCPHCQEEYDQPLDRRFHAQPVACPDCGPDVYFLPGSSSFHCPAPEITGDEALQAVAHQLQQGHVIAVKGLGGFHLTCHAANDATVQRLREQKHRPHKPLAIMMPTLDMARQLCHINPAEESLLTSPAAPAVLLRRREETGVCALSKHIAPGNNTLGVMLPYTPLHHLLLQTVNAPLVMTSGNPPGEPLCIDNQEAWRQLRSLCDGFLMHDRPIERRCDDSVLFVARFAEESEAQPVRRSRGYAPLPLLLPPALSLAQPLVAAGADMKNVSAVAAAREVFLTQHIGNLDSPNTRAEQALTLADFEQLFNIRPGSVVCDLHPNYASSRYARERAAKEGLPLIEVQHHHAHIAACLAENDHAGPAIGLAFDGTGFGTDRHIWGGEVMLADWHDFVRLYHLEYLPLPGGDAAVRRPYRTAIAYLRARCPEVDINALFPGVPAYEIDAIYAMLQQDLNTPLTSSMGRLFDAVSAILGLCHQATFEAQAAIALEAAASRSDDTGQYHFSLDDGQIRLGDMLHQIVADRLEGVPVSVIARRFHNTIAAISLAAAQAVCDETRRQLPVALSGGVWQNRLLLEMTVSLLREAGFVVLLHRQAPANDGGLAYGQAVVAAARLKESLCA